jgi:hypothetical protein
MLLTNWTDPVITSRMSARSTGCDARRGEASGARLILNGISSDIGTGSGKAASSFNIFW